jgi:Spherulation-specific family 4
MKAAGVRVLGYVYTNYGSRDASSVVADMRLYKTWYNVSGIFIDEMSQDPSFANYYSNLTSQAHAMGLYPVIGNPGVVVDQSLITSVDYTVIYESSGLPSASSVCETGSGVPGSFFSLIASGVSTMPPISYLSSIRNCVGLIYFTDQTGDSELYSALPSYLSTEVSELSSLNGNSSG